MPFSVCNVSSTMKINLVTAGLFDARQFSAWTAQQQRAVHAATARGFRGAGSEVAVAARAQMQSALQIKRAGFLKSLRARVLDQRQDKLPALRIGSNVSWLGIHESGGRVSGNLLIPLLPKRIGRKRFKQVVDGLMRSGNAFFKKVNGKVILFAENITENRFELGRFKPAERSRSGNRIKRGQEVPIALLINTVSLKKRLDLEGVVRRHLPRIATAVQRELDKVR
jgi:hypothetical protein